MSFSWEYHAPNKDWWANYRWHITESSEKLGLKNESWKKVFFRRGWQSKMLKIKGIDEAKKCLKALQNGTITAFGGRFRGAIYDKNAKLIVKQAQRSLKEAIKKNSASEIIKETAILPPSYYNWWVIIPISGILLIALIAGVILIIKKLSR